MGTSSQNAKLVTEIEPLLGTSKSSSGGSVLCVDSLSYSTPGDKKSKGKLLFQDVSFTSKPGELTAVMGKAGPWMPTLLQLCASHKSVGSCAGKITYDGNEAGPQYRHLVSLIAKEDQFSCISNLTVSETLMYMARLRLGGTTTVADRESRVDELISMLGLDKCRDVRLGSETVRGISGGEKKRVGLGLGLVSSPSIVILDEPTTGLDSAISFDVMGHVKESACVKLQRTVVVAIHMPSEEIFNLFDKLVLVSDGRMVYSGPAADAASYFSASPHNAVVEAKENPADFLISVCSGGRSQAGATGADLEAAFVSSDEYTNMKQIVTEMQSDKIRTELKPHIVTSQDERRQMKSLFSRTLTQFFRSRSIWSTELGKMTWIGLLYSSSYTDQSENADGAINLESCFYFSLMFGILGNLRGLITLFDERKMFEHERMARAYSPYVYWVVTSVAQMPWLITINILFSSAVFWSVGLWKVQDTAMVFVWYLVVTQLTNLVGFAWAQMLASYCSAPAIAMAVWQPAVYIFSQTSGFPIQKPAISHYNPAWALMVVSFTRWAYQALVIGVFHAGWGDVSAASIFAKYGFEDCPIWFPIPILLAYVVGIRFVTYWPLLEPTSKLQSASRELLLENSSRDEVKSAVTVSVTKDTKLDTDKIKVEPIKIKIEEMHYSVSILDKDGNEFVKPLVRGISLEVSPGEICAVMGPSGAGKSTFLDLIAGRKTTGFGNGKILYNGEEPTFSQRSKSEAYVMQHDAMINQLSVMETLRIACMLRLNMPSSDVILEKSNAMIELLGLEEYQNTLVGGLSAGQRRLVSVASEIVHGPSIIYLDEPTSGLDSAMALQFLDAVTRLRALGSTIVCTIHQPTEQIFFKFSKLLIVGDGFPRYVGTPEGALEAIGVDPSSDANPAEELMKYVQVENKKDLDAGVRATVASTLASSSSAPNHFDFEKFSTNGGLHEDLSYFGAMAQQCYHLYVHIIRNIMVMGNNKKGLMVAFGRNLFVAVWYGCVYWQQTDEHTLASVCYFSQQFICMSNLQAIPQMFAERTLFYRERGAGFYSEAPYLMARVVVNAGLQLVYVGAYSAILYPMVGLRGGVTSSYFVYFTVIMYGLSIAGYAFSNLIAALTPNQQSAMNLYSALFQFCMFFCGYSIPVNEVPAYWSWATKISFARYSFESLALNQFSGDHSTMAVYYLEYWGFFHVSKYSTLCYFVISVTCFHVLAWAAMKYISYERR